MSTSSGAGPSWEPDEASQSGLRDIKSAYKSGNLVLVVGAGVTLNSLASSSKDVPKKVKDHLTWPGLLRHGLTYLKRLDGDLGNLTALEKRTLGMVEDMLHNNTSELTTGDLIHVAGLVKKGLGHDQVPNWLQECFRRLYPDYLEGETIGILQSIRALRLGGARIMTTNYDDIIERYCDAKPVLPRGDDMHMNEFIHGGQDGNVPGVLHVHGHWRDPRNAVLDIIDYHKTTSDEPLQRFLQQMFDSTAVLVFVGTGDGLDDPNFGGLLQWAREKLRYQASRHFVLMKAGDRPTNRAGVSTVFYGSKHSDLAPFLQEITNATPLAQGS